MKKLKKIIVAVVVLLILMVVTLLVLANVLITPERVRQTILPLAEENLQRKIELGNIKVSWFSGIEIHGLKIYEKDSDEAFISTELVRFKYQLLPLLAMRVVVDEVRLEKPIIRMVRFSDGQFNFSSLPGLTSGTGLVERTGWAGENQTAGGRDKTPISLLISQAVVADGQLTFLDHVLNDQAPYRYEIKALQIAAKGITLTGKVPLSLQCEINGNPLTVDGQVIMRPLGGTFDIELQNLDMVPFKPYFQEALPGELGGLKLNFKASVSGSLDEIFFKGKVSLKDLDLQLDAIPDAPVKKAQLNVNYGLIFTPEEERLQIHDLGLDYNGIKINAKGVVSGLKNNPVIDLSIVMPELQIRQALDAIPQGLVDIGSLDPAGELSVEATLSGNMTDIANLLQSANFSMNKVQATVGNQRPAFSGHILVNGEQLSSEDLQVRLGDNKADIELMASQLYTRPIIVRADISSQRFLLEPLLQGSAGPVIATDKGNSDIGEEQSLKVQHSPEEVGPFDIPLHATGAINVSEAIWKGLTVKNFLVQYQLQDNILNLIRIDGEVAGGTFNNSARIDLGEKGLAYSAELDLQRIQSDALLTAFVPKTAGSLFGVTDLKLTVDGRGIQWPDINRNLSGIGKIHISDGQLVSSGLVKGLSSFLQLAELDDIQFDNFTGQFKIEDGKVRLDAQLHSSKLKLDPRGSIGLDGSLHLELDTRLSPELSSKLDKKGNITRYLADKDGWTRLPLLLKGSFASPSFRFDPGGMQVQATKAITNELSHQLDKLLKSQDSLQESGQQQAGEEAQPETDPARKLLQKLFGN